MTIKGGYFGRFLEVNLTNHTVKSVPLDEEFARKLLGGVGFGS